MIPVVVKGHAPAIQVFRDEELIETIRSEARLEKRIRQEGWEVEAIEVTRPGNPSTLASQIREEGESWQSAMTRAYAQLRGE